MKAEGTKLVVDETPERLRVRWRTGTLAIGCFFLVWMSGWTVGCVLITSVAMKDPKFVNVVGAAVFDTGWLFGFVMLVSQFLGREKITLSSDGLTIVKWSFVRNSATVPIAEIFGFTTERESSDGSSSNSQLEVRTAGRPQRLGSGLSRSEIVDLAAQLRKYHGQLPAKRQRDSMWPPERERIVFRPKPTNDPSDKSTAYRSSHDGPLEPPSDTRMRRRDDFDAVRFSTRGRLSIGAVIVVALLDLFWSGITGIFVYNLFWGGPNDKPQGFDWYEQFVILIPFELVGLAITFGVLLVLLEPFRVWSYRFSTTDVRDHLTWFGLGWRKRYDLGLLDRLEVRKAAYSEARLPKRLNLATLWTPPGCPTYSLVLIEMGNREVCAIEGLTFGEACWMADVVIRRSDFPWGD